LSVSCNIRNLSHSYGIQRLFSGLNADAENNAVHLVTGSNGSGKSTLLRLLSSAIEPEPGSVDYFIDGVVIPAEKLRYLMAFVAPYQEIPEEFSLMELIEFQKLMEENPGLTKVQSTEAYSSVAALFGLDVHSPKLIRDYSTGMRQKAKFVLAFGSGRPIWLLDEPGANLDAASNRILQQFLLDYSKEKLIIMASNEPSEISIGRSLIHLGES